MQSNSNGMDKEVHFRSLESHYVAKHSCFSDSTASMWTLCWLSLARLLCGYSSQITRVGSSENIPFSSFCAVCASDAFWFSVKVGFWIQYKQINRESVIMRNVYVRRILKKISDFQVQTLVAHFKVPSINPFTAPAGKKILGWKMHWRDSATV